MVGLDRARRLAERCCPEQGAHERSEVQVHDRHVERAAAGQRVAVNLSGLSVDEVARGDVLVGADGDLRETYLLDAELEFEASAELETGIRVQVHHGTASRPPDSRRWASASGRSGCERPLIATAGDRVVIRRIAPPDTLGGGRVLDPIRASTGPAAIWSPGWRTWPPARPSPPAAPEVEVVPAPAREAPVLRASALELEARLRTAGFEPPLDSELDAADLAALREAGRAVRVTRSLHYHPDTITAVKRW